MPEFRLFDGKGIPVEEGIRNWREMVPEPYDKLEVDAYSRCRIILMNGIENNATMTSHAIARMTADDEVKKVLAAVRRADSQHQQFVNWLHPSNQTVIETTIGFEQVAVDLTAWLAQNEPDAYFRSVLDFGLLEDFDHLFRYGCLMELIEGKDPNQVTQGYTEVKPGRPTKVEHRHPLDEMRLPYDKDKVSLQTKMNYYTIVSGEQQTMLFYKEHGLEYGGELARGLYTEIAEIEQQHVSQYEACGDPRESPLEKITLMQLCEAYNYYSAMETESDPRLKKIWERLCEEEMGHFQACADILQKTEGRSVKDILRVDSLKSIVTFEPQKEYVNKILAEQVDLQPYNMEFVPSDKLPKDWPSFAYQEKVNAGWVPSEEVVKQAEKLDKVPAESRQLKVGGADIYERLKQDHLEVKKMFEELTNGDGGAGSEKLFDKLKKEIEAHSRAEEAVLYEPLKKEEETKEVILEGYQEHHAADLFLREMADGKTGSDIWMAKASVLMEMVEHHVVEEEGEMFQKARMVLDDERARAMVKEFETEKKKLLKAS
jgi:rubrerythrin